MIVIIQTGTIMQAITKPFDFEVKNRLLQRGPNENLKKLDNFMEMKSVAPKLAKHGTLCINRKGELYTVLGEIGKGRICQNFFNRE